MKDLLIAFKILLLAKAEYTLKSSLIDKSAKLACFSELMKVDFTEICGLYQTYDDLTESLMSSHQPSDQVNFSQMITKTKSSFISNVQASLRPYLNEWLKS